MEEKIKVIEQNRNRNNNHLLSPGLCQALGQMHVLTLSLSSAPLSSIHPQSPCEGGIINPTLPSAGGHVASKFQGSPFSTMMQSFYVIRERRREWM